MENSSVNKAHYQHRRAETHLRYRRFEEAIECHKKASELLEDALQTTSIPRAIESLKLQRSYHIKQQDIIRIKREQFENYKKAVENQRKRMASAFPHNEFEDKQENESTSLQVAIYKTMEEADSLLEMLFRKNAGSDSDSLRSDVSGVSGEVDDRVLEVDTLDGESTSSNNQSSSNNNPPVCTKHPKDATLVIEELRTLNHQLHTLVYQLVTQLDASTREADALRSRVRVLESERIKTAEIINQPSQPEPLRHNSLRVVTDSSGGTSPFVFSPCSELSPEIGEGAGQRFPVLTPLDLPNFDFGSVGKK